ncbi:MAG TPA: DNA ligase D [Baekduia sp.]|nr:DNA ligase D [Baekduia sp.]
MADRLGEYKKKRDFGKTSEPEGEVAASDGAPRFVIQEHSATRLHWDLRLEHDGALASWALPNFIPNAQKDNRLAVRTEDHPLKYLDFHGEIPKGEYGAGTMTIYDSGTYEVLKWDEAKKIEVEFHGERVTGRYAMFVIGKGSDPKEWMIHRMGEPLNPHAEPMPEKLVPMLAHAGPLPADEAGWAYEIKWDGVRALAYSSPGRLRFFTRTLNEVTSRYPELHRLNRALHHHTAIVDGEIVSFVDGKPSFEALQQRMNVGSESRIKRFAKEAPVTFVAFDLLWLDGHSLTGETYADRRDLLARLELDGERWQTPAYATGGGADLLKATADQGLEGIIAKRLDSRYEPGRRSQAWVKVKNVAGQEVVIGGWTPGAGKRSSTVGALLVGIRDGDSLRYCGRLGTGFDDAELDRLTKLLQGLERKTSPFNPDAKLPKNAHFATPKLVAEAEFAEWTRDGLMRAPRYKGLRDDKAAGEVVREPTPLKITGPGPKKNTELAEVGGRTLQLSNRSKVLYPQTGFTKGDLIDYYARVAPVLLPHLEGRALTLKRYPNGVEGQHFYEKNAPKHRPEWVATVRADDLDYVTVTELATLVWLGNLADLELHTPMARAAHDPDQPTMVAFDLDPGPGTGLAECCEIALTLRAMFEHLKLRSFAKTSGSKGMQLYVPLNRKGVTHADTKAFAKAVAELMATEQPDGIVSRQAKELRKGKVLIDWSQNSDFKTTVTVYSPRAKDTPTVSTPLTWDEVADGAQGKELSFDTAGVLTRIDEYGDLFAEVLSLSQRLPSTAKLPS